jgi:G:T/U-mismatch repair DNA glycosylase
MDGPLERGASDSWGRYRKGPDVLSDGTRILLEDIERRDFHVDESRLDVRVSHQVHEGGQAHTGAQHIRGKGVSKAVGVGDGDASRLSMMAEKRT